MNKTVIEDLKRIVACGYNHISNEMFTNSKVMNPNMILSDIYNDIVRFRLSISNFNIQI